MVATAVGPTSRMARIRCRSSRVGGPAGPTAARQVHIALDGGRLIVATAVAPTPPDDAHPILTGSCRRAGRPDCCTAGSHCARWRVAHGRDCRRSYIPHGTHPLSTEPGRRAGRPDCCTAGSHCARWRVAHGRDCRRSYNAGSRASVVDVVATAVAPTFLDGAHPILTGSCRRAGRPDSRMTGSHGAR